MTERPLPLIAGNWKMNGLAAALREVQSIAAQSADFPAELLICPPATLIMAAAKLVQGTALAIGGQDCHQLPSGAHTGDISAPMLRDAGATYVIIGHSERRADHFESDWIVNEKVRAADSAGLLSIICVGETKAEREAGQALNIVEGQLAGSIPTGIAPDHLTIAYEPVWAIGTGLTPTSADIAQMHGFIRNQLAQHLHGQQTQIRILYGGSVKPGNAAELLRIENVDGALVGGASLTADDFLAIAAALR
jgi:triosephosphate isomerase